MFRGFMAGAMVGFFFGSSKQGAQLRSKIDGMLSSLRDAGNEEEGKLLEARDELAEVASFSRVRDKFGGNVGHRKDDGNGHRAEEGKDHGKDEKNGVDTHQKSQEHGGPKKSSESAAKSDHDDVKRDSKGETGVPMDKAKELAEALNAKPTPPPTDELEPS